MARKITCTNNDGVTVEFGETAFSPFLLATVEGIYSVENTVTISENTMTDGGTYQASRAKIRNIILTVTDKPENVYGHPSRSVLYALFPKGTKGTLTYWEDGVERVIDYYVESISLASPKKRLYTISLLCPDPFFYAKNSVSVQMANWISGFEFVHEFTSAGEEFGYRSAVRLQNIVNDNAADGIGMTIVIRADGAAQNPTISHVESGEHITVGSSAKPLRLRASDYVIITTETNNKHVFLERDGERQEINEYLTEDSEFIQLLRGDNNIGYSAESGEMNLSISISYRLKFEGA